MRGRDFDYSRGGKGHPIRPTVRFPQVFVHCKRGIARISCDSGVPVKTKDKLLLAAEQRFLQKGYTATTVDEICSSAGATKGAFFHHFPSKEALALTVVEAHGQRRYELLTATPELQNDDPEARMYAFVDHVIACLMDAEEPACLTAGLTLELAGVNPKFKSICDETFTRLIEFVSDLFDAALANRGVSAGPTPRALAESFVATYQGALVLSRARADRQVIRVTLGQFRNYLSRVLASPTPAAAVA